MRQILASVLLLGIFAPGVAAQTVSLTPSVIELKGSPGQSTTQTLTMRNATGLALSFDLEAMDVLVKDGKRTFLPAGDAARSIAVTAVFSPQIITIPPGESRPVTITVTVPRSTEFRAVIAMFRGTTRIGKGRSTSTVSLGALLTFTLSGHHSLTASALLVAPQSDTQNAAFEVAFVNTGAEPETPRGVATVLGPGGAIVGKASFEQLRVLPGERLTLKTIYPGELARGSYRIVSTFEFAGQAITRTAALIVP